MKLLLDYNLPKRLKSDFPEHEIYTVSDRGWNGKENGELMQLLIAENFDALLTFDKNLQYRQNFRKYAAPIFVLHATDDSYLTLSRLITKIKEALAIQLQPGSTVIND